jgi:hypothetical protein
MKQGKYFQIPEGPQDIDRMWRQSAPLGHGDLPPWLSSDDSSDYRCVGSGSCAGRTPDEQAVYLSELEQLELAGLIAESSQEFHHRLYLGIAEKCKYQLWSIGIYTGPSPLLLAPATGLVNPVLTREHVSDVPASFVADPFMIRVSHSWYMFFEVLNWRANKGEIGLATSADGRAWEYRRIVLAEPFHLSYPCVFQWMNDYYMIPETYQSGSVRLYKALDFPERWTIAATLLTGERFVDPSIFRFNDRWWLFAETNPDDSSDTLRLYYADDLPGPWREHQGNPLIAGNPRLARPGGRVLVTDSGILRFAQDCYPGYGTCLRAFRVAELTTTSYREREVAESPVLGPCGLGWNAGGMHHLDAHPAGGGEWMACVDGWTGSCA